MTFIKTIWTKIKSRFTSQQKQPTLCINPFLSDVSKSCNVNNYTKIDIVGQDVIISDKSGSSEPYFPIFTIFIGLLDIFMLMVVYIVQEGTVLTSDTWIRMGCKYVPCMKPLYSKTDQEIYNAGLKSQCQSFPFPYQFFRFITPIFLHGDITHLLSNLVYQALVGSLLETKYGRHILGISYLLFGFSGNIMSALCNPTSISVGASGAVYGLLLFCSIDNTLRICAIDNIEDKTVEFPITLLVIPYVVLSIFFDVDLSGRTDHAAHIGGALMGILVAMYLCEMPEFITNKVPDGKKRIQLISLILIISYFIITLLVFYLFIPANLK